MDFGATTQVFHVGRGSAAVPLALSGLLEVHRRRATLPLTEIVAPAIELGRSGYVLGDNVGYVFELLRPSSRARRSVGEERAAAVGRWREWLAARNLDPMLED